MDSFKHVNNVTYVKYQESARLLHFTELCNIAREAGHTALANQFFSGTSGIGPILADSYTKFRFPVTFPDTILAGATVLPEHITPNRVKQTQVMWSMKHNRIVCEGYQTIAGFDYIAGKACDIPQPIHEALLTLNSRNSLHLEDHLKAGLIPANDYASVFSKIK